MTVTFTSLSIPPPRTGTVALLSRRAGDLGWLEACVASVGEATVTVAPVGSLDDASRLGACAEVWAIFADTSFAPRAEGAMSHAPWVVLADNGDVKEARALLGRGAWDVLLRGAHPDDARAAARRAVAYGARLAADATRSRRAAEVLVRDVESLLTALASSAAHGINAPLANALAGVGITRHIARTLLNVVDSPAVVDRDALREAVGAVLEACDDARRGIDGAVHVTRGIALLGGSTSGDGRCDVASALEAACAVAAALVRERAELRVSSEPTPPVTAPEAELTRLCLMLLIDAARALPGDVPRPGTLSVALRARNGRVLLTLEDATALPADAPRDRRWLHACGALARAIGAELTEEPAPRGRRVTISLPVSDAPPRPARSSGAPPPAPSPRRGRVLLIDDEPTLLSLMKRILQRDHEVIGTTRPAEAVARIAAGERFDLVLCDLMMPEMSGMEVYREVSRDAPEQAERMVFITAGAFSEQSRAFLRDGRVSWVEKPIDPDDLRALVAARVTADRPGPDARVAPTMRY